MTEVEVLKKNNNIVGYIIEGHTGYDVSGKDIVCAAISVLGQTALIALNEVCEIDEEKITYDIIDDRGYLSVSIIGDLDLTERNKADVVFKTMVIGIKNIVENYSKYVTLKYREV